MGRPSKEQEFLHCRLDKQLSDQIDLYAAETRRTRTAVVELALSEYFDGVRSSSEALTQYAVKKGETDV